MITILTKSFTPRTITHTMKTTNPAQRELERIINEQGTTVPETLLVSYEIIDGLHHRILELESEVAELTEREDQFQMGIYELEGKLDESTTQNQLLLELVRVYRERIVKLNPLESEVAELTKLNNALQQQSLEQQSKLAQLTGTNQALHESFNSTMEYFSEVDARLSREQSDLISECLVSKELRRLLALSQAENSVLEERVINLCQQLHQIKQSREAEQTS
jgi:chromosome segregation ATPase